MASKRLAISGGDGGAITPKAAFYDINPGTASNYKLDNVPLNSPNLALHRIYFHSDFEYMQYRGQETYQVSLSAVPASGLINTASDRFALFYMPESGLVVYDVNLVRRVGGYVIQTAGNSRRMFGVIVQPDTLRVEVYWLAICMGTSLPALELSVRVHKFW